MYGFRLDGKDKVTYSHFDSYPDELGANILSHATNMGIDRMKKAAGTIIMVDKNSIPCQD